MLDCVEGNLGVYHPRYLVLYLFPGCALSQPCDLLDAISGCSNSCSTGTEEVEDEGKCEARQKRCCRTNCGGPKTFCLPIQKQCESSGEGFEEIEGTCPNDEDFKCCAPRGAGPAVSPPVQYPPPYETTPAPAAAPPPETTPAAAPPPETTPSPAAAPPPETTPAPAAAPPPETTLAPDPAPTPAQAPDAEPTPPPQQQETDAQPDPADPQPQQPPPPKHFNKAKKMKKQPTKKKTKNVKKAKKAKKAKVGKKGEKKSKANH